MGHNLTNHENLHFGAGEIGSRLAVELSRAGHSVSTIAWSPHLKASQQNGLKLLAGGVTKVARIDASDDQKQFDLLESSSLG